MLLGAKWSETELELRSCTPFFVVNLQARHLSWISKIVLSIGAECMEEFVNVIKRNKRDDKWFSTLREDAKKFIIRFSRYVLFVCTGLKSVETGLILKFCFGNCYSPKILSRHYKNIHVLFQSGLDILKLEPETS